MRDILAWALATEIVGLAVLPLLRSYFGNRRDAALLSRPLGLAIVAYLAWALSLLTPFGFRRETLLLAVAGVAGASWLARRRTTDEAMKAAIWGDEEKLAAALFWASTGVFLLIRAVGPAILGAEKFMDLAFLNSLARYPGMPPADPWMSGKTINYYYWGYLMAAAQAKLSGVPPLSAYNLAVATFAGYSFVSAACLGLRLSRGDLKVGLGAAGLTVFAGNLAGAFDAWANPFAVDFDYWHASRVIGPEQFKTINEFPFFTFFHADLHPHLLAFPYFIAAFAVAHRWMESGGGSGARRWLWVLLVALTAGTARAASLWNMPAMAILLSVCGALRVTRGQRLPRFPAALGGGLAGLGVFALSRLLFYPYTASFQLENKGLGRTTMFSGAIEFLGVWGILFAVCAVGLWPRAPGEAEGVETEGARRRRDLVLTAAAGVALAAGFVLRMPAMPFVLILAFLAARAGWRSLRAAEEGGDGGARGDADGVFAAFVVLLGLAMVAGCELVYFKDTYGLDLQRMNTIFKFYHQAWPVLGIGAVAFAGRAWHATKRPRRSLALILGVAVFAAALYPATAMVSRLRQHEGRFTLDARSALERRNRGDLEAIEWLRANAPGNSVVMEAAGDPYTEFARISSHTGIPSVLGWANHEGLWRSNDPDVMNRFNEIRRFYTTADPGGAREILRRYGVTHVVVGDLERTAYGGASHVASFPFLERAAGGTTTLYRVSK
jgi:YYY domain-containing protein